MGESERVRDILTGIAIAVLLVTSSTLIAVLYFDGDEQDRDSTRY